MLGEEVEVHSSPWANKVHAISSARRFLNDVDSTLGTDSFDFDNCKAMSSIVIGALLNALLFASGGSCGEYSTFMKDGPIKECWNVSLVL